MVGEIGGSDEEAGGRVHPQVRMTKPVVAYIAGVTAPPGKRMGHAGAIDLGRQGHRRRQVPRAGSRPALRR
jgi:succinyl-CoA synthetase alpha subunit